MLQEFHNARGIVDDNFVGAPDDLPDLFLVVENRVEVYLVVGYELIDLRCRLPELLATWPVFPSWTTFPAQSTIAMATISSSTGLGPVVPRSRQIIFGA